MKLLIRFMDYLRGKVKVRSSGYLIAHYTLLNCVVNDVGHIHDKKKDFMNIGTDNYDPRYVNVNMDVLLPRTGEIMLNIDELFEYMK